MVILGPQYLASGIVNEWLIRATILSLRYRWGMAVLGMQYLASGIVNEWLY